MRKFYSIFALAVFITSWYSGYGNTPINASLEKPKIEVKEELLNTPPSEKQDDDDTPMTRLEYSLSMFVLLFGFVIVTLEMILVRLNKLESDDAIKFILITLIVTSTLFLITAGYSNNQIAPAMGLLGTIAGYLLGKQKNEK